MKIYFALAWDIFNHTYTFENYLTEHLYIFIGFCRQNNASILCKNGSFKLLQEFTGTKVITLAIFQNGEGNKITYVPRVFVDIVRVQKMDFYSLKKCIDYVPV